MNVNLNSSTSKIGSNNVLLKHFKRTYELYFFMLPGIIFYFIFKYVPIYGVQIAFRDFSPVLGFWKSPWIGLENFDRFFHSADIWVIVKNTLSISITNLIFGFPIPIILALMLNQLTSTKFKKLVQTVTYAPNFISMVVLVGMLYTMLNPRTGVVNIILKNLGLHPVFFMGRTDLYVPVYVISGIWQTAGWSSVVYIAALASISPELHESAVVDGANKFQRIWHIDIPGIIPVIVTMLILSSGNILTVGFEKSYLMQNSMNLQVSEVISTFVYKRGLLFGDFSYATTVGLCESLVNFIILVTVNTISSKLSDTSLW